VDGKKLVTQKLDNNRPGEFYDAVYPLARNFTRDKEEITVKFQAHPGRIAGGVFAVLILVPETPAKEA
jgi:uncharacterized protein